MSLYTVGRLCLKIAGRDAGKKCVIIENVDDTFVLIDGATRRKKVNVRHLEPLAATVEIKAKASHEDVNAAFDKLGIEVWNKKSKKVSERPKQVRKVASKTKGKPVSKPKKQDKKEEAKAELKVEAKVETSIEDAVAETTESKDSEPAQKEQTPKVEVKAEEPLVEEAKAETKEE